jgi:hypothetical protein
MSPVRRVVSIGKRRKETLVTISFPFTQAELRLVPSTSEVPLVNRTHASGANEPAGAA